jgi:mRNA-degrading endonuclease toxin of MazEF toxin-antitoxin module
LITDHQPPETLSFRGPNAGGLPKASVILVDQIKAVDWKSRTVKFIAKCPSNVVAEVEAKLRTLLAL